MANSQEIGAHEAREVLGDSLPRLSDAASGSDVGETERVSRLATDFSPQRGVQDLAGAINGIHVGDGGRPGPE